MTEYTMKNEPPYYRPLTTAESVMVNFHPTSEYVTFDQLREELRKKPDLVEVVRCRDCKWWDKKDESDYGYCHACKHGYSSPNWQIGIYRIYKGNFFCADGEIESEEEEDEEE